MQASCTSWGHATIQLPDSRGGGRGDAAQLKFLERSQHLQHLHPPPMATWLLYQDAWCRRATFTVARSNRGRYLLAGVWGANTTHIPAYTNTPCTTHQGAFLGIFAVAGINQALEPIMDTTLLIPSLGATAVLIFGVPESKLSQPRNVLVGQWMSAVIGIATRNVLGSVLWLSGPVGMSLALLAMRLTSTTHPPGMSETLTTTSAPHVPQEAPLHSLLQVPSRRPHGPDGCFFLQSHSAPPSSCSWRFWLIICIL